jgi:protein gp37
MGINTGVAWATSSWNPWMGCDKVSAGCKNCYAERNMKRYGRVFNGNVVRTSPATFNAPLKWYLPRGSRIFVCSWSDFFHQDADGWREEALDIIRRLPQYDFLIPTKRIERVNQLEVDYSTKYNIWLGVSVENQYWADKRIPILSNTPAQTRWLSIEPMLGFISFEEYDSLYKRWSKPFDWVVYGGESGPNCRPCNPGWIREGIRQCREVSTPTFVKQLGGWPNTHHELDDFPEDLRVREFPK